jgi:hypothetical protein
MLECKPDEKSTDSEVDVSSMSSILKILLSVFNIGKRPALPLPLPLGLAAAYLKPGMSPRNIAARQIAAAESIGLPMGNVFSDGPNKEAQKILSDAKEFHKEISTKMAVTAYALPNSSQHVGTGSAGPIPIVITSANIAPMVLKGDAH